MSKYPKHENLYKLNKETNQRTGELTVWDIANALLARLDQEGLTT